MIGSDFPPNDFTLFGLDLTDPTDFIYDVILGVLSFYLAKLLVNNPNKSRFKTDWIRFFFFFGLATTFSAFGHLFFNYFHFYGKLIGWMLIPFSIYWIEVAVVNGHWNQQTKALIKKIYLIKLVLIYLLFIVILSLQPFVETHKYLSFVVDHPEKLFLPIAVNTMLGLLIAVGVASNIFRSKVAAAYLQILIGVLIILPSAFIFILKINLHPWFSKNDFSHLLMVFGVIFFYLGAKNLLIGDNEFLKTK